MKGFRLPEYVLYVWFEALVVVFSVAVLVFLFSINPSTYPMVLVYLLIFSTSSTGVLVILSTYKLIYGLKVVMNPFGHFLRGARELDQNSALLTLVEDLKRTEKTESLRVVLSDAVSGACTIGNSLKKAAIILPRSLAETLAQKHLRAILLHEIYHLKENLSEQNSFVISDILLYEPISFSVPAFGTTLIFCTTISLASIYGGFDTYSSTPRSLIMTAFWLVAIATVAYLLVAGIFLYKGLTSEGWITEDSLYVRELLADAYSLFKSRDPQTLKESLIECHLRKNTTSSNRATNLEFESSFGQIKPRTYALKGVFRSKGITVKNLIRWFKKMDPYTVCPIEARLSMVDDIQKLLQDHSELDVNANQASPIRITHNLPKPVYQLLKGRAELFKNFLEYARVSSSAFNLEECSQALQVELFDAFLMLVGALELGLFDFKNQTHFNA